MKNILDVVKQKEAQLQELQEELEVLHTVMRLLSEEGDPPARSLAPTGTADTRPKGAVADIGNPRSFP